MKRAFPLIAVSALAAIAAAGFLLPATFESRLPTATAADPAPTPAPTILCPAQVAPYRIVDAQIQNGATVQNATWLIEPEGTADVREADDGKSVLFVGPPGVYKVRAVVFDGKRFIRPPLKTVTIGDPQPVPPDPVPPVPPDPTPTPLPTAGLNVAVIGPSPAAIRNLTPAQVAILTSRTLRDFLEKNCEKCEDGSPAYRGLLLSNGNGRLAARWQSILQKAPKDTFTLAAVKGQKAYFAALPADTQATLKVIAEVAGVQAPQIEARAVTLRAFSEAEWEQYNPPPGLDGQRAAVVGEKRYLSLVPRDFSRNPAGKLGYAKPLAAYGIATIPRSEWPARIAALKGANAGLQNLTYVIPPYDQGTTNYCWVNCVCQGATAAAYEQGRPIYPTSPASVGGPLTHYRNVGGMPGDAMAFVQKTGAVGTALWPANAIASSYFAKAEVQADYPKNLMVDALADLSGSNVFDEVATCVLLGAPCPVAYNWWSHAVLAVGIDIDSSGKVFLILRNSWGKSFGDNGFFPLPEGHGRNKGTPDDAQAILSVLAA